MKYSFQHLKIVQATKRKKNAIIQKIKNLKSRHNPTQILFEQNSLFKQRANLLFFINYEAIITNQISTNCTKHIASSSILPETSGDSVMEAYGSQSEESGGEESDSEESENDTGNSENETLESEIQLY